MKTKLTIMDTKFEEWMHQIMSRFDKIDTTLVAIRKVKDILDGDTLLDVQDMCTILGITKRTLARYRQKKLIRYYIIDGRTYYKASEIKEFLIQKGKDINAE